MGVRWSRMSWTEKNELTCRVSSDQSLLENDADRTGQWFFVLHKSASRQRRRAPPVHVG